MESEPQKASAISFRAIIVTIVALIALLLVFQFGVVVGFHKADFAHEWSDHYQELFGLPHPGVMHDLAGGDFTSAHGTSGTIASIAGTTFVVNGDDAIEKTVSVDASTAIVRATTRLSFDDLVVDDQVVVIGEPDASGTVAAKLIRVFPNADARPYPPPQPMMPWFCH